MNQQGLENNQLPLMQTGFRWLWLTLIFLLLDQVSKYLAVTKIEPREIIEVMPFFNFVIRYNEGAAFSFLNDAGGWQKYFLSGIAFVVSLALLFWLYKTPAKNRLFCSGVALILAGAIGNLIDRVRLGKVVDFIDWYYPSSSECFLGFYTWQSQCHWPALNIADAVILLGAILFLVDSYTNRQHEGLSKSDSQKSGS